MAFEISYICLGNMDEFCWINEPDVPVLTDSSISRNYLQQLYLHVNCSDFCVEHQPVGEKKTSKNLLSL